MSGDQLDALGILVDFTKIKELARLLPDHELLNEVLPEGVTTTAEGLSRYFFRMFRSILPAVTAVTVHEGPGSWCRYEEK